MKKIVKLTETDLTNLVKKVINEDKKTFRGHLHKMGRIMMMFDRDILKVIEEYQMKLSEVFSEVENDEMLGEEELERLTDEYERYMSQFENMENDAKKLF